MFFCALSGEPPQEPVVSVKSGKVYERRLILKYITENGTDPITGDKLEESDLVVIKASPETSAPRTPSQTSIPALLRTLQDEWDALVLETFALKQQYNSTRQELSYALYNQDAANRVVARLIRERDAAREALGNVQASMGIAPSAATEDVEMNDENAAPAMPEDIVAQIDETHLALSSARKKRKPPPGYASAAEIKSYTAKHTIPSLHSSSPSGITSLAVSNASPSQFLTGGNDKIVQLYDRDTDKVLASLKGHTKKINHVAFREREGEPTLLLSGGADKIAKIWSHDSSSGEYIPKHTIRAHKGEITGLTIHPRSTLLTLASADKTYSLHDLSTLTQVFQSTPAEDAFSSLGVHPDGTLLALGTPGSKIHIYDIRTGAFAAILDPPEDAAPFTVNSLSFSENGYHLLAPSSLSTVAVWDLRKRKTAHTIDLGESFKVNKVAYDTSAQFLGVAGSQGARVFAHKSWEELSRLEEGGEISDFVFGVQGREIWGATGREVRIWGSAPAE
ncbi:WD40-repeat-containing domain protein [Roridomyces roridus]|uniref:Pre-mRNA-processing factor 19 n=1 Tax=Roridomyces roridus TaxID=1738132 RepID=A0AAD7BTU1_9AGAR|nr:WD40-repeat-containing domain protein [Roridomyces roridus]